MSAGSTSLGEDKCAQRRACRSLEPMELTVFGLIGSLQTTEEGRSIVAAALLEGCRDMPGNLAYLIAEDAEDPLTIWVTEVWESEGHHKDSLNLSSVQAAIAVARTHITGMGQRIVTRPLEARQG